MKVFVFHPPLYPINHHFFNLLADRIGDLTVISYGNSPGYHKNYALKKLIKEQGAKYKVITVEGEVDLKKKAVPYRLQMDFRPIINVLRKRPDIIISVAFWIPSLYLSIMRPFMNFKLVISSDATIVTDSNISFIRKVIRRVILNSSDSVIAGSKLSADFFYGFSIREKVFLSLQTIDVKGWMNKMYRLSKKNELRLKLHIPKSKKVLISVGSLIERKNWQAVINLVKSNLEYYYILIGDGPLYDSFLKYINENGLHESVLLVKRKEGTELMEYLKAADIFILPSLSDRFGYVVPEALCSGLPVICSKFAGASSLIVDGYNGYIVDPHELSSLEISYIINNYCNMSRNALSTMLDYTLEKKADDWVSLFEKIM